MYYAENYLPAGTTLMDVEEYLALLGFKRFGVIRVEGYRAVRYWHYDEEDFERFQGLVANIILSETATISVQTESLSHRNKADCDIHNSTLRHLKKRFGGYFSSDYGRNRYFKSEGMDLKGAEAGCYLAYWRFRSNFFKVRVYLRNRRFTARLPGMEENDPAIVANNMLLPFLVAAVEEFLKSTYKTLVRYSDRRIEIFRGAQIRGEYLVDACGRHVTPEEAMCRSMTFQNVEKVVKYFSTLDRRLDIRGQLQRPYRRRKRRLYESLEEIIRKRHELVHRAQIDISLTDDAVERTVSDIEAAIRRVYEHLIEVNSWSPNDQG